MFDAFFWLVMPVAGLEALRIARSERKRERRSLSGALLFGGFEFLALGLLAATASPLLFMTVAVLRMGVIYAREHQLWLRGAIKTLLVGLAAVLVQVVGRIQSFAALAEAGAGLGETWRLLILGLIT
ncbi:MAG: hypothetical protein KC457_16930, partial [Myxococcales bacterium]|nr:hypothetical protein [Myxococcales bacterium]